MPRKCEFTGKKVGFGQTVSHANNKSKRRFNANLQRRRVKINGVPKTVWVSAKYLRTLTKRGSKDVELL